MGTTMAERLKAIIDEKGYKQYVIAERAGLTAKELSDLLTGRKTFKADYVKPLCKALWITPNELFGCVDEHD